VGASERGGMADRSCAHPVCILNMFGPCNLGREPLEDLICSLPIFNRQTVEQAPALYASACPLTQMTAYFPPTMTMHGTNDQTVPYEQALELDARLSQLGVEHQLVTFNGGHEFANLSETEQLSLDMQGLQWMTARLRP
jgi:dipeptidyl aminopeptidase/acylaminoacyl peptidase